MTATRTSDRIIAASTGLFCTLFCLGAQGADAQNNQFGNPFGIQAGSMSAQVSEPKEFNTKVSLPDIPEFTGKATLEQGLAYPPNDQVEGCYSLTYQAREDAASIVNWYRGALSMYKWNIDSTTSKALTATNTQSGNTCSIYCDNEVPGACKLHISYSVMKKEPGNSSTSTANY